MEENKDLLKDETMEQVSGGIKMGIMKNPVQPDGDGDGKGGHRLLEGRELIGLVGDNHGNGNSI